MTSAKDLPLHFYESLPMEHMYEYVGDNITYIDDKYFAQLPENYKLTPTETYIVPKLFSYTISVDNSGALNSLQFRFAEVVALVQNYKVKHSILNGLSRNLLWA